VSDDVLGRIAGWCLADPRLTFHEDGPAVEVAGDPPVRLGLAVTEEQVLLSHQQTVAGAGAEAAAKARGLVNQRGSLLRGNVDAEGDRLTVSLEYPIYLDGLNRQTFLLATQEVAGAADTVAALGTAAPAQAAAPAVEEKPAAGPEVILEPAAVAPAVTDTVEMPAAATTMMAFSPTHEVPPGGMSAWARPDPSLPAAAHLEARVQLRVDETRGAWARVTGSNGWSGWVDARRLVPLGGAPAVAAAPSVAAAPVAAAPVYAPQPAAAYPAQAAVWQPTHQVPAGGLPAWAEPDPGAAPVAQLAERVQLRVDETRGAWARVTGSNGWSGWVDARRLAGLGGGGMALGGLALRPLPLIGAVVLIVATFLPWLRSTLFTPSANGWDLGLPILWNITNPGDQPRIGLILLIVGIIALAGAFVPKGGRGVAAAMGVLGVVIGGLYLIQVIRLFGQPPISAGAGDTLGHAIGFAPWIALAGGVLLLVGSLIPERRS
jgi:SH3-like domain-containing protein